MTHESFCIYIYIHIYYIYIYAHKWTMINVDALFLPSFPNLSWFLFNSTGLLILSWLDCAEAGSVTADFFQPKWRYSEFSRIMYRDWSSLYNCIKLQIVWNLCTLQMGGWALRIFCSLQDETRYLGPLRDIYLSMSVALMIEIVLSRVQVAFDILWYLVRCRP